jgi:hypothetical protein
VIVLKTLIAVFIYPKAVDFFEDYLKSLENQTIKKFDFLIFDDNSNINVELNYFNSKIIKNINEFTIAESRKYAIDYSIKMDYDLLIFSDVDDIMANDRIEKTINTFDENISFYYNDIFLLSNKKVNFFNTRLPDKVDKIDDLIYYNFLGLSNTAINIKKEKEKLRKMVIDKNIKAFDWYLYSYLLLNGGNGKKINTKTYYRIYENNIAGDTKLLTKSKLMVGIDIKKTNYRLMNKLDSSYEKLYFDVLELEEKLKSEYFINKYINYVNENYPNCVFWWENIKILSDVESEEIFNDND